MNVHTRHARMVYCDAQPIVGTGTNWLPFMAFGLVFILTVVGVSS